MPITHKKLQWTIPVRDWKIMTNAQKRAFLYSKGFNSNVKIEYTKNIDPVFSELIRFTQDDVPITKQNYQDKLASQMYISDFSIITDELATFNSIKEIEEIKEEKPKGLQFYPFYKPEINKE